jgi:hypothetical protein
LPPRNSWSSVNRHQKENRVDNELCQPKQKLLSDPSLSAFRDCANTPAIARAILKAAAMVERFEQELGRRTCERLRQRFTGRTWDLC